ncbi:hypothetical protein SEA_SERENDIPITOUS_80 [Mycobacterium phage Serendipitous]|uniref:Uncharacterized protein n=1 Tax=Mycobacterium phage Serendipitous TaxID=2301619 RepID=A0A385UG79_9CAUD|nr:hypothetical protein I5G64_gp80 [Mycobacterium phage Serendipitous]AYB70621.1 hypothetical protein SEA_SERENDIPITOUS_80 [Mycobacterium phage Serendipitous]
MTAPNLSPQALALARIRELVAEYGSSLVVPINRLTAILDDWEREEAGAR